nr:hypothetical protein CFP56_00275 [Quercus suber]
MHYNASASVLSSSQTVSYSGVNLYALPIIVALEVTDLPVLAAASTAAPAQSVGSQSAPTSDSSSFSSSPHSGLSTSAKAGIGVGVALGVILLTLGCLLLLRRRRKTKTLANGLNDGFTGEKAELPSESRQMAELDTDRREPEMDVDGARHEVDGVAKWGELDGTNAKGRAELDGGWRGEEAPVVQRLPKRDENYV